MVRMNESCSRCAKVLALEVTVDDQVVEDDEVSVDVIDGAVLYVCNDCLTNREVWQRACQGAAAGLDACDESIARYEMVLRAHPKAREDPTYKAAYAQVQEQAQEARETLVALMRHDPEVG